MDEEATEAQVAPMSDNSSTLSVGQPGEPPKPKKKSRSPLAPSSIGAPPTPAPTSVSRTPSLAPEAPESNQEPPPERQSRLVEVAKAALKRKFPQIFHHEWLLKQVTDVLNKLSLGTVTNFANTTLGKTRFPRWAENVGGDFQLSLAEMLACFGCREVLTHPVHDKFRCVVAEQHIVQKIHTLLSQPALLDQAEMKVLRWNDVPFNVINGSTNVDLPAQEIPLHTGSGGSGSIEHIQNNGATGSSTQTMKREVQSDQAFLDDLPPVKRVRTAEDDAQDFLTAFQEEARTAIWQSLETLEKNINQANAMAESEVVKIVREALDTLAKDIPSKLDSSLDIFAHNLKQDTTMLIQENVKVAVQEALTSRDGSIDDQIASRFAKIEDIIREEIRNLPIPDTQTQAYPVYCMPGVPLQMPQVAGMGGMAQQMLQGPALGGYIQPTQSPRNMRPNREGSSGGFQGRRPN